MKINIFVQHYPCREDDKYFKEIDKNLVIITKNYERKGHYISHFNQNLVGAGENIVEKINSEIEKSQIILLLMSTDFLHSALDDKHLRLAFDNVVERHKKKEKIVLPIILSICEYEDSIFGDLASLPPYGKSISEFSNRKAAYRIVNKGIKDRIDEIINNSDTAGNSAKIINLHIEKKITTLKKFVYNGTTNDFDMPIAFNI